MTKTGYEHLKIKEIVKEVCLACDSVECCKQFEVPLTPAEFQSGKYKIDRKRFEEMKMVILAKKNNGECYYLNKDNNCSIWQDRPSCCKEYFCKNDERIHNKGR